MKVRIPTKYNFYTEKQVSEAFKQYYICNLGTSENEAELEWDILKRELDFKRETDAQEKLRKIPEPKEVLVLPHKSRIEKIIEENAEIRKEHKHD